MIYGKIDKQGNVTITFNTMYDRLIIDKDAQLLPCETCGLLTQCHLNCVSVLCDTCHANYIRDNS